ncbi:DUF2300 domain-containing protein [Accumulibacter sp.]|uniref:DUF2300 domain-containing protein n=1 Tax=Accumulibacter sp. TaxID=2053492 RepID=UPI002587467A|nr:DUF2300 domain-containing protein [Accumulibacter sp.]
MTGLPPPPRPGLPVRCRLYCLATGLLLAAARISAAPAVELVFGDPEAPTALRVSAAGSEAMPVPGTTPLGSLWKVFVHAYLSAGTRQPADYHCSGRDPGEESYCCAPGESIGRDAALAKSCGLYFSPRRLALSAADWRAFWLRQAPQAPAWLFELDKMQPASEVTVRSLLAALAAIDADTRRQTMAALQRVSLEARARPLLSHLGNSLRVKTWSWNDGKGRRIGGFAGWLADGTPLWLRGSGSSAQVIEQAAPWLAGQLPQPTPPDEACVRVRFFSRYPLSEVLVDGRPAAEGPLRGRVEARFSNSRRLFFASSGELSLGRSASRPEISGRFALNEYVARVLQREAGAQPAAAARALAIAARTYLVRHAGQGRGCYEFDDDSRTQRVSPAPPERAALRAAEWSDGLILSGVSGRYHQTRSAAQQLSWQAAVAGANAGARWDEILESAYGGAGFGIAGEADAGECQPLSRAENWLAGRQGTWKRRLAGVPGFETPAPLPRVCRLDHGNPYADLERGRIYATGIGSANERLTIAHEYLHFALANHPRGRDEDFIERTARTLLDMP